MHQEDVVHFPPELTDPDILADIVNFSPNKNAMICSSEDSDGNNLLEPPGPVEEFMLIQIKVHMNSLTLYRTAFEWEMRRPHRRCQLNFRGRVPKN